MSKLPEVVTEYFGTDHSTHRFSIWINGFYSIQLRIGETSMATTIIEPTEDESVRVLTTIDSIVPEA